MTIDNVIFWLTMLQIVWEYGRKITFRDEVHFWMKGYGNRQYAICGTTPTPKRLSDDVANTLNNERYRMMINNGSNGTIWT